MKIPLTNLEINMLRAKNNTVKAFPANIQALELRKDSKLVFQLKLTLPGE